MKIKKLFILLLVTAALLSMLIIPVAAADDMSISENYSTITYLGEKYLLVDTSGTYSVDCDGYETDVALTDTQAAEISSIEAYTSDKFIDLYIVYNKGGSASYLYVHEDLLEEFKDFAENGGDTYTINLFYDSITLTHEQLFGKAVTIKGYELSYYYEGDSVQSSGMDGTIESWHSGGYIFGDGEGNIYYFDFDLSPSNKELSPQMNETLTVWQITDKDTLAQIKEYSFDNIYGDYDDTDIDAVPLAVSVIILALFIGIAPLACAVVCFIISLRAGDPYKKCLRIAAALFAATALVAIITIVMILALA